MEMPLVARHCGAIECPSAKTKKKPRGLLSFCIDQSENSENSNSQKIVIFDKRGARGSKRFRKLSQVSLCVSQKIEMSATRADTVMAIKRR